jgi:DNA-binding transcriptional LysR family regulator
MNNKFEWTLIQSFLAAVEAGSLLGAAKALGTSQPTVGRHIAELEAQLSTVLFERTGRGLRPTEAAMAIVVAAREMETHAQDLVRTLSRSALSIAGTVRISASQSVACELLPPILAAMRVALPQIQVEVVSSNAVSNLLRRDADIALRMVRPNQSSLIARKVAEISIGAYAQKGYVKRRGAPRALADLLSHELIGNDADDTILRGFRSFGFAAEKSLFALRTDDQVVQWQAVRAGLGIGFISDYLADGAPGNSVKSKNPAGLRFFGRCGEDRIAITRYFLANLCSKVCSRYPYLRRRLSPFLGITRRDQCTKLATLAK